MALAVKDDDSLQQATILQALVLGGDLLVAFSNGTSVLLTAEDIKHLALTAAKAFVTDQEVDEPD